MNVSLTPELEQFVQTKVESGRYNSASEVVREALRLLEDHEQARTAQLAQFNQELGQRLASLDSGERVEPGQSPQSPPEKIAKSGESSAHERLLPRSRCGAGY